MDNHKCNIYFHKVSIKYILSVIFGMRAWQHQFLKILYKYRFAASYCSYSAVACGVANLVTPV